MKTGAKVQGDMDQRAAERESEDGVELGHGVFLGQ